MYSRFAAAGSAVALLAVASLSPGAGAPAMAAAKPAAVTILNGLEKNMSFPYVFQDGGTTYLSYTIGDDVLNEPSHEYRSWKSVDGGRSWSRSADVNYASALRVGADVYTLDFARPDGRIAMSRNGKPFTGKLDMRRGIPGGTKVFFGGRVVRHGSEFFTTMYAKVPLGPKPKGTPAHPGCATNTKFEIGAEAVSTSPGYSIATSVAVSRDGVNWYRRADISTPRHIGGGRYATTNESSLAPLPGGRLYAVLRSDVWDWYGCRLSFSPLRYSYSTTGGQKWSGPSTLLIKGKPVKSYAQPTLMRSGSALYLGHGRPDNHLARAGSYKGGLPVFSGDVLAYANRAKSGYWTWGSSGYTALAVLHNRVTMFADNCAAGWGCRSAVPFTHGRNAAIIKITF